VTTEDPAHGRWRTVVARLTVVLAIGFLPAYDAAAQAPERVDAPLRVDPAICTPMRSGVYLPFGSERIAVMGVDADGACIVELFAEEEGGYHQRVCRLGPEAPPLTWDPAARQDRERDAAWYAQLTPSCEVVATGNFLMPDAEPVTFPRHPWFGPRTDPPSDNEPTGEPQGAPDDGG
jgi:hypothetical protein